MELTTPQSVRASATQLLEHIDWIIDELTRVAQEQMSPDADLDYVRSLLTELEKMKTVRGAIAAGVEKAANVLSNSLSYDDDSAEVDGKGLRRIRVQVTEGMIKQSLLTLTVARKSGRVKIGESFHLTLPDGSSFTTELCNPGNKLRERSGIRRFYQVCEVREGHYVLLTETTPGRWTLEKETHAPVTPL